MYHCDVSRGLSLEYKRIVQWDRPLLTLCCLVALTVLIGFFHDYTLPVVILMLLGVILWCLGIVDGPTFDVEMIHIPTQIAAFSSEYVV